MSKISDDNKLFGLVADLLSETRENVFLPAGGGENNTVSIIAVVSDSYGAKDFASTTATVSTPQYSRSELGAVSNHLANEALDEGDVSLVFQVLSSTANILNSVNCSLAPNCNSLGRAECSAGETSHTCGECLNDLIPTIVSGNDVNTMCVTELNSCTNGVRDGDETDVDCGGGECGKCDIERTCSSNLDCKLNSCNDDNVCGYPRKTCGMSCNGRGTCLAYDYNKNVMSDASECTVDNDYCFVKCECDDGFFGKVCDKSQTEISEAIEQRKFMLQTLSSAKDLQDVDTANTNQQISGIEV